jgi:hypothetical protein
MSAAASRRPAQILACWRVIKAAFPAQQQCMYGCIDTGNRNEYAVFAATQPCDLSGIRSRTGRTFASMTFDLKLPFSLSTIPAL